MSKQHTTFIAVEVITTIFLFGLFMTLSMADALGERGTAVNVMRFAAYFQLVSNVVFFLSVKKYPNKQVSLEKTYLYLTAVLVVTCTPLVGFN